MVRHQPLLAFAVADLLPPVGLHRRAMVVPDERGRREADPPAARLQALRLGPGGAGDADDAVKLRGGCGLVKERDDHHAAGPAHGLPGGRPGHPGRADAGMRDGLQLAPAGLGEAMRYGVLDGGKRVLSKLNPKTGEKMTIAASKAIKFKASKALKDAVQ